jgi:spoIIIJ-associated protein
MRAFTYLEGANRLDHREIFMMNDRPSVETTGDTIDEAVARGLAQLGVGPSEVIVEVLEEPSRGVFGIGARQAKVRLQMLRRPAPPPPPPEPVKTDTPSSTMVPGKTSNESGSETGKGRGEPRRNRNAGRSENRGANRESSRGSRREEPRREGGFRTKPSQPRSRQANDHADEFEYHEEFDAFAFGEAQAEVTGEDVDIARQVLQELLQHMNVRAEVRVTRAAPSQEGENPPYLLNVEGRDVNSLIGRRGETLSSLQYITRLITSRRMGHRANIVVDVGSYKARRSQKLRELAVRMADQAVKEARTVVLEPMPPHERRMIHMALRSREDVFTRSTGEGDSRKVTIVPKQ